MTIQKWLKEEKMRLERFKICCVNAQKKEAESFPLKMPRSCWSGQYRTWDDFGFLVGRTQSYLPERGADSG
jgi:hypothetical protein